MVRLTPGALTLCLSVAANCTASGEQGRAWLWIVDRGGTSEVAESLLSLVYMA